MSHPSHTLLAEQMQQTTAAMVPIVEQLYDQSLPMTELRLTLSYAFCQAHTLSKLLDSYFSQLKSVEEMLQVVEERAKQQQKGLSHVITDAHRKTF